MTPVALIIASLLFPSSFSRRLSRGRYPERKPYPGESDPSFPFSVYQVTRARFETTDPIRVTHASPFPPISLAAYAVFLIPRIRVHCLPSGRGGGGPVAGSKRKSLRCPKLDLCHRRVCPGGIVPRNNATTSYNYVKYTIRTRQLYIIYIYIYWEVN